MTDTLNFSGQDWKLGWAKKQSKNFLDEVESIKRWANISIPGSVFNALINFNILPLPIPFYNLIHYPCYEKKHYWLIKNFPVKENNDYDNLHHLIFKGIDYKSKIYLNNNFLGEHLGMFSPAIFNVTNLIKEKNELLLKLFPLPDKNRTNTLRCQMTYGWDFSPRILSPAVWDDVYLHTSKKIFLKDFLINTQVNKNITNIKLKCFLWSNENLNCKVNVNIKGHNFEAKEQNFKFNLNLKPGDNIVNLSFILKDFKVWEIYERGFAHLYKLNLQFLENNELLETVEKTFGIRTIEFNKSNLNLYLNGKKVFLRGANWVPANVLFADVQDEDYKFYLSKAKEMGLNILRVWGGGLREKQAFYNLADENGILIWQEFPFACIFPNKIPTSKKFISFMQQELTAIVNDLSNHPSLSLFCGGNEYSFTQNKKVIFKMQDIVQKNSNVAFHPVSPYKNESHNWQVWHNFSCFDAYINDKSSLMSEFGMQALPSKKTLQKIIPKDLFDTVPAPMLLFAGFDFLGYPYPQYFLKLVYPFVKIFKNTKNAYLKKIILSIYLYNHTAQLKKLLFYVKKLYPQKKINNLYDLIEITQTIQAFALKVAVEHFRVNQKHKSGVIFWQLDEPSPAVSWAAVIDHFKNEKKAFATLKQSMQPLAVILKFDLKNYKEDEEITAKVFIINNSYKIFENVQIVINKKQQNKKQNIFTIKINIKKDKIYYLGKIKFNYTNKNFDITAEINVDGKTIANNNYSFPLPTFFKTGIFSKLAYKFFQKLME